MSALRHSAARGSGSSHRERTHRSRIGAGFHQVCFEPDQLGGADDDATQGFVAVQRRAAVQDGIDFELATQLSRHQGDVFPDQTAQRVGQISRVAGFALGEAGGIRTQG